jgi:hypothetical protein
LCRDHPARGAIANLPPKPEGCVPARTTAWTGITSDHRRAGAARAFPHPPKSLPNPTRHDPDLGRAVTCGFPPDACPPKERPLQRPVIAALFGRASIAMLLADRVFICQDWLNWREDCDIPFAIRVAHNRLATRPDGCRVKLAHPDHAEYALQALHGHARRHVPAPALRRPRTQGWQPGHSRHQPHRPRCAGHLPEAMGHRDAVQLHQKARPELRGYPPDRPCLAAPAHRSHRAGRLVRAHRQTLPWPGRPDTENPRIPRQILGSDRRHLPPEPLAITPPGTPRRMGQRPDNPQECDSRAV